jgi:hypothetical protein
MMEPAHEYKNIDTVDHHDDDSSTEVESLVGLDKQWVHDQDYQSRTRRSKRNVLVTVVKTARWWLVIGLQLVIVALLARDQGLLLDRWLGTSSKSTSANEVGGDITGWGPHSTS